MDPDAQHVRHKHAFGAQMLDGCLTGFSRFQNVGNQNRVEGIRHSIEVFEDRQSDKFVLRSAFLYDANNLYPVFHCTKRRDFRQIGLPSEHDNFDTTGSGRLEQLRTISLCLAEKTERE
jgi:hypothetical protein